MFNCSTTWPGFSCRCHPSCFQLLEMQWNRETSFRYGLIQMVKWWHQEFMSLHFLVLLSAMLASFSDSGSPWEWMATCNFKLQCQSWGSWNSIGESLWRIFDVLSLDLSIEGWFHSSWGADPAPTVPSLEQAHDSSGTLLKRQVQRPISRDTIQCIS